MDNVTYRFEYENRLRACFIGAGGHSFRNIYPALQYAPVDLVAVCDRDQERAAQYASQFGAERSYSDYMQMLEAEKPDIVFIVTAYDEVGTVQATKIAIDCAGQGVHVWMEKPTANTTEAVVRLREVSEAHDVLVMTGLKKMFTPAIQKAKELIGSEEFGPLSSISVRYPQDLPAMADRYDGQKMRSFLDHIYHPAAVLRYLGGSFARLSYEWEPNVGSSVSSIRFDSGAIGTLHLAAGAARTSPLERVEIIGRGANLIIENGVRITYYRAGATTNYGRSPSFVVPEEVAPLVWEPEFSLGQLYNKNLFYLGYVPEILHFCEAVQGERKLEIGTLDQVMDIMAMYETYQRVEPGSVADVQPHSSPQA